MESQRSEDVRAQFVAVLAIFVDVLAQSTGALWYAAAPAVYATAATNNTAPPRVYIDDVELAEHVNHVNHAERS